MHHSRDAGGQVEFLARDISTIYQISIEWRAILVEVFYVFILLLSTGYIHVTLRLASRMIVFAASVVDGYRVRV